MRRNVMLFAAALAITWAGSVGSAQTIKIANADEYGKAMEALFFDFASANFSIVALAPADAQNWSPARSRRCWP